MTTPPTPDRYATLDGLRGAAALLVAVYHLQQRLGLDAIAGYLAVDLFFCLSGFVIARSYEKRLARGLTVRRFAIDRAFRFYPLYLTGLAIGMASLGANGLTQEINGSTTQISGSIALNALMIPTPLYSALYPLNGAAWSLFFELAVNLLFALVLWRLRTRALACIAVISLLVLGSIVRTPALLNLGWQWEDALGGSVRTLFSFTIGMMLARTLGARRPRPSWWAIALPFAACLPIAMASATHAVTYELLWIALAAPFVIAFGAWIQPPAIARAPMLWLGDISFALYATHWPLAALLRPILAPLEPWRATVVFLLLAVATAQAVVALIDRPAQRWWRRRGAYALTTTPVAAPRSPLAPRAPALR